MRSIVGRLSACLLAVGLLGLPGLPARAVDVDWVTVDGPGNDPDDEVMACCRESIGLTGFGQVDYVYRIGRTEITNAQYAEFLNAVAGSELADDDPKQLYNARMRFYLNTILQNCVGGECTYEVTPGVEDRPVAYIDFFKALRFANWLHNGQRSGPQDETTTEDGAYTLLGSNPLDVARNAGALFALSSEDEWYKAAFYDPELQCYWDFATGTNDLTSSGTQKCPDGELVPSFGAPPGQPTTVTVNYGCCDSGRNCNALAAVCDTTDVGAYIFSPSPNGTFDQAGNLNEWTEGVNDDDLGIATRVIRGGVSHRDLNDLKSMSRPPADPNSQLFNGVGFRVTAVPEPAAGRIVALGLVLGLSLPRRRRLARVPAAREARRRSRA